MNVNQIINMVTNQIIRRVVNMAVDGGMRFAQRKAAKVTAPDPTLDDTPNLMTPAELAKDAQLRAMADNSAKRAAVPGRLGR